MAQINLSRRNFLLKLAAGTLSTTLFSIPSTVNAMDWIIDFWEPHEYINKNGQPDGTAVKIIQEAEKRLQKKYPDNPYFKNISFVERPWKRGLNEVLSGNKDGILSGLWNKSRANEYYIPEIPVSYSTWQAYKLKKINIASIEHSSPILGKVNGYYYPPEIQNKLIKIFGNIEESKPIPKNEFMYLMLLRERIQIAIFEKTNLEKILNELEENMNQLEPIPNTKYCVPLFAFINRDIPYQNFKLFEKTLFELKNEGFIEKILKENQVDYHPNFKKTGEFAHN